MTNKQSMIGHHKPASIRECGLVGQVIGRFIFDLPENDKKSILDKMRDFKEALEAENYLLGNFLVDVITRHGTWGPRRRTHVSM